MLAAARRLGQMIAVIGGSTALLAALAALATGGSVSRAVSFALYIVGMVMIVVGFFAGVRGPLRARNPEPGSTFAGVLGLDVYTRGVRVATGGERQDALATTVLFFVLGVALIVLGVVADSRVDLV